MFFEEFFGSATNQYNQTTSAVQSQTLTLYVQLNSNDATSYIGDEQLPLGANPFYVPPPTPVNPDNSASVVWIVILCVVISLLAGFLGWAIYKWRKTA